MATRKELKELALLRLNEAETLFAAGLYDGAGYLCGYVLELALKARICRILDLAEYPATGDLGRVYATHDLVRLLTLAGLRGRLAASDAVVKNWGLAAPWKPEEQRYDAAGSLTMREAEEFLEAIRNRKDGVLTWIKKFW
jgi:HEPN domain-containing protein